MTDVSTAERRVRFLDPGDPDFGAADSDEWVPLTVTSVITGGRITGRPIGDRFTTMRLEHRPTITVDIGHEDARELLDRLLVGQGNRILVHRDAIWQMTMLEPSR